MWRRGNNVAKAGRPPHKGFALFVEIIVDVVDLFDAGPRVRKDRLP
jgi:hypothetical protein